MSSSEIFSSTDIISQITITPDDMPKIATTTEAPSVTANNISPWRYNGTSSNDYKNCLIVEEIMITVMCLITQ